MKIEHIIWDWNGTLLNDVALCTQIINSMLAKRGIKTLSEEEYRTVFTFPVEKYYRDAGFTFENESFETVGTEFIELYNQQIASAGLFSESVTSLNFFKMKNIRQSILSARHVENLKQDMNRFRISGYFQTIFGIENHYAAGKLELGKQLLESLHLAPEKILLIGDTLHDAEVARKLGTQCILVAAGHQSAERLKLANFPIFENLGRLQIFFQTKMY